MEDGQLVKDNINNILNDYMEVKYLGIDIGGTNIKSVILSATGEVLEKGIIPTEDSSDNPEKWKKNIIELIDQKTKTFANGNVDLLKCAISAPGLVCKENKQILNMPDRLTGLERFNWSVELNRDIKVVNDAHSACLAEYESFYKGKINNMLLLTLGTGVGGAAILDGKLFQGSIQRAGHFGHITVDHMGATTMTSMVGSLEYVIGNFSVEVRTYGKFKSTKDLVTAYKNNDPLASYWWLSSVQKLATGLASLINAFSPDLIILGGGIVEANDALFNPLDEFMSLYEWRPDNHQVRIEKANYANYAGAVGAAFFAKK